MMCFRTPSIRISTKDVSKKSSENGNNNRNHVNSSTGDGSISTSTVSDPLKEFETEHIPEIPPDDHNHSHTDFDQVDTKWSGNENGPVTEVSSVGDNVKPGGEGNLALSFVFILLLVALIIIPVAFVVQSNKEAIKSSAAYHSFASWFQSVTGVAIL